LFPFLISVVNLDRNLIFFLWFCNKILFVVNEIAANGNFGGSVKIEGCMSTYTGTQTRLISDLVSFCCYRGEMQATDRLEGWRVGGSPAC
jgi:hypothetical protein